jgi:hypothetical protein
LTLGSAEVIATITDKQVALPDPIPAPIDNGNKAKCIEIDELKEKLKQHQLWIDKTEDFLFRLANYKSAEHKIP